MKNYKKIMSILLMPALFLIIASCNKYNEEPPFFDGLFFEYDYGGGLKLIYNVYTSDNNGFNIIETDTFFKSARGKKEMSVDKYGKVNKSNFKAYEGIFSPVWIPVHEISVGDSVFGGDYIAVKKDRWKKWNVMVIKATIIEAERYFDLSTGYWVGSVAKTPGGGTVILSNTNANIPTIEE